MRTRTGTATGKIILSGEYAMAFGKKGIAFPSVQTMDVRFRPSLAGGLTVIFGRDSFHPEWAVYAGRIAECIAEKVGKRLSGELSIETNLPLGKGMGSSTALVIGVARTLLGSSCEGVARAVEDEMNPGHSGMDFAVIWEGKPILYERGQKPHHIQLPKNVLKKYELIDTGMPNQHTPELVAWVRTREEELKKVIDVIGHCTQRILEGEDLKAVLRDHHRAQVALGVVPRHTQEVIRDIEERGGMAKVIGAGGRTGGGGMIFTLQL